MKKLLYTFLIVVLLFSFVIGKEKYSYAFNDVNYIQTDRETFNKILDEEILIILDFSSSMIKKLNDKSRATHAVYSIYNILDSLPSDTKIGLRVFGPNEQSLREYHTGINSTGDCKASKLAVPISKNNNVSIRNAFSIYTRPFGESPIEYSLVQAINNDFSPNSMKHIVLVTDGDEGCGGNPCGYISNLMRTRQDIKIDVILISDSKTVSSLSCLSRSTNGTFVVVNNPSDLYFKMKKTIIISPETQYKTPANIPQIEKRTQSSDTSLFKKKPPKYSNYMFEFDI